MMSTHSFREEYVEGYQPGTLGRITELHGVYYAEAWGSGVEFEGMMAQEIREFLTTYQPGRDLLLTAQVDGTVVGSIVVAGDQRERPGARLRWVIVDSAYQGRGIGKQLLERALAFCRQAGYVSVFLWTVDGLSESMSLYLRAGFRVVHRVVDDRWSIPRTNLLMELAL